MDFILKAVVVIMIVFLTVMQLLLVSPYAARLYYDNLNGCPIKTHHSAVSKGDITLELLGEYSPNKAKLLINGDHVMSIDRFPLRINLNDCDVVEIFADKGMTPFYVYLSDRSGNLETDLIESSVQIKPGINRVLAATIQ